MADEQPHKHHLIAKLEERKARHKQRHIAHRTLIVIAGGFVTLAGVIMTGPVPGPGIVVIPVGLAMLALEFEWAERLLHKAIVWAEKSAQQARDRTRGQKIVAGVLTAIAIAGAITAVVLWDIPWVPV